MESLFDGQKKSREAVPGCCITGCILLGAFVLAYCKPHHFQKNVLVSKLLINPGFSPPHQRSIDDCDRPIAMAEHPLDSQILTKRDPRLSTP
jgi:hypothetical protein